MINKSIENIIMSVRLLSFKKRCRILIKYGDIMDKINRTVSPTTSWGYDGISMYWSHQMTYDRGEDID